MFECPTCDREFEVRRGLGVHHVHAHDRRLPNRTCDYCEDRFYSDSSKKYCSEDCLRKAAPYAGPANPNYKDAKKETSCEICGQQFKFYPSDKKGLYCPDCVENESWRYRPRLTGEENPSWKGGKIERTCEICGDTIRRRPGQFPGEVALCGMECHANWLSKEFEGDGHPNGAGGIGHDYGNGWWRTRIEALDRDNYTCQVCGLTKEEIGRNPDVHHIVPVREFIESEEQDTEDAHSLDNVITLCVTCHRRADHGKIPPNELRSLLEVEAV